jgi:hypothetical protein
MNHNRTPVYHLTHESGILHTFVVSGQLILFNEIFKQYTSTTVLNC